LVALGKTYLTYLSTIVSSTGVNLGLVTGAGLVRVRVRVRVRD
jgi:hypothetical protein